MPHVVDVEKCEGCEACVPTCPTNAISMVDAKAKISEECVDCGTCIEACPTAPHPADIPNETPRANARGVSHSACV